MKTERLDGRLTRRGALKVTATAAVAAAFPSIVPARALGRGAVAAASERITLGVIGIGPRCTYDLKSMLAAPDVQCVAISDVQASRRKAGKKLVDGHYQNQDCMLYRDFRELLARPDIDAVLIATGDRWHAPASILAAQAGKDVYSEKPCGLTIADCQALADTMNRYDRVFQAGTQRRSVPNFQAAVQLAHSGKLGKLHTLYASVYIPSNEFDWLPAEPSRPATWSTGTSGSARRRGGPTTMPTSRAAGAATTTSTREPGCWTGARTPSTSASGPTRPTTPCPSSTSRHRRASPPATPTA